MGLDFTCPYCNSSNLKITRGSRVFDDGKGISMWQYKIYSIKCLSCNEYFELHKEWRRKFKEEVFKDEV